MSGDKVVHPSGDKLQKIAVRDTTPSNDNNAKVIKVTLLKQAIVFFIGGAADKESYYGSGPNNNILDCLLYFQKQIGSLPIRRLVRCRKEEYLGYNEVYGDVKAFIKKYLPNQKMLVYIVGHSLGGYNGAWLSRELTNNGYRVPMLITLDPVGTGLMVEAFSNIPSKTPEPSAEFWINLYSQPDQNTNSDLVANAGERWHAWEKIRPSIDATTKQHHANAIGMFTIKINHHNNLKSACDWLIESLDKELKDTIKILDPAPDLIARNVMQGQRNVT